MIVVDTNVLAYLWLPGIRTQAAERLLKKDPDWNAPLLWRSEFRNVLAGCLRRGDLDIETALQIADGSRRTDARSGVQRTLGSGARPGREVRLFGLRL